MSIIVCTCPIWTVFNGFYRVWIEYWNIHPLISTAFAKSSSCSIQNWRVCLIANCRSFEVAVVTVKAKIIGSIPFNTQNLSVKFRTERIDTRFSLANRVKVFFFLIFTLYSAHSRVCRRILESLRVEWLNSTSK